MARIKTLPNKSPAAEVVAQLHEDGVVVIRDVFDETIVDSVRRELSLYLNDGESERVLNETFNNQRLYEFLPGNTKRVTGLIPRSATFQGLVTNPLVLGVCDQILGPLFQLSGARHSSFGHHPPLILGQHVSRFQV
jgi:hypothetical protein